MPCYEQALREVEGCVVGKLSFPFKRDDQPPFNLLPSAAGNMPLVRLVRHYPGNN